MGLIAKGQKHMGHEFVLLSWPPIGFTKHRVLQIMEQSLTEVKRLEDLLTDFRESPFNLINQRAGLGPVQVNDEILFLIERALEYSRETQGAFDITYASVGHLYRRAKREGIRPTWGELKAAKKAMGFHKIIIDKVAKTVFLPHPAMRIGLGGMGKGLAVDRVCEILHQHGLRNFCVNGAGDLRVHSTPWAPRPWRLGLQNPLAPGTNKLAGLIELKNGSLATSGDYQNTFMLGDRRFHHVMDPRTGKQTEEIISATVMTTSAMDADVYATSVMVMGVKKGLRFLEEKKLSGVLINARGKVFLSERAIKGLEKAFDRNHSFGLK